MLRNNLFRDIFLLRTEALTTKKGGKVDKTKSLKQTDPFDVSHKKKGTEEKGENNSTTRKIPSVSALVPPAAENKKKEIIRYTKNKHREWALLCNAVVSLITTKFERMMSKNILRQLSVKEIYSEVMKFDALIPYRTKTVQKTLADGTRRAILIAPRHNLKHVLQEETIEKVVQFMKLLGWDYSKDGEIFIQIFKIDDDFDFDRDGKEVLNKCRIEKVKKILMKDEGK